MQKAALRALSFVHRHHCAGVQ